MSLRALAMATAALLGSSLSLSSAVTYHPWSDGSAIDHGRASIVAVGIAVVSWATVRATIPPRPIIWVALPWLLLVATLVPSTAVHFQRINHPVSRSGTLAIEDTFDQGTLPDPRIWVNETLGEASTVVRDGAAVLKAPPGSATFLDLITPDRPDPNRNEFWLPRGLYVEHYDEVLDWEASIHLESEFSIVLQTRQLLVQATPYGLHITYPNAQGRVTEHHIEMPNLKDGEAHHFTLERTDGLIRLRVGDESGWVQPDAGRFELVRFGETRVDPLHAGTLSLHHARYVRRYFSA